MKSKVHLLLFASIWIITSCKKEGCTDPIADNYNPSANDNDGSCQYTGQLSFWMDSGSDIVDVTVNGITAKITQNYSYAPGCGTAGCANFTLPSGTYTFYAEEEAFLPDTWTGTVVVPKADCKEMKLVY